MGCKQLFVNLGGSGGGGSVNTGVLQIAGGVALDSTLRVVEDQNGTDSILKLSTTTLGIGNNITSDGSIISFLAANTGISFYGTGVFFRSSLAQITYDCGAGTGPALHRFINGSAFIDPGNGASITTNGVLTIKSNGSNIISARNSSNVEVAYVDNNGRVKGSDLLSNDLTSGSLTTAKPIKFGDKATITDAGLTALGLDAQIAIEHNGQVYYVPVSTSQFS